MTEGSPADAAPRVASDRGATSLAVVLLTPLFVVMMFATVQAALWGHARTEARVVAKSAASQVARQGASVADAQATAVATLASTDLTNVAVDISAGQGVVIVTVTGDAPGIIIGTARSVSVTEAVPIEELSPR